VPLLGGFLIATLGWRSTLILFGRYFAVGAAVGAPWALLIGAVVDGYGFAAAFATMAVSQVLAALVLIPLRLRRTVLAVPSRP
jgi:sugar phosphate permease